MIFLRLQLTLYGLRIGYWIWRIRKRWLWT